MKNTTPNLITTLNANEIFVFGSNLSGIHGAGAAAFAMKHGAIWGKPIGLQGSTYAIPTKSHGARETLSISEIGGHVKDFINFAKSKPNLTFLVTEIGCGLAGLTPVEVAPLFEEAMEVENIYLPKVFIDICA